MCIACRAAWIAFENEASSMSIEFSVSENAKATEYVSRPDKDNYWKIGLALPDVTGARKRLVDEGIQESYSQLAALPLCINFMVD